MFLEMCNVPFILLKGPAATQILHIFRQLTVSILKLTAVPSLSGEIFNGNDKVM